MDSYAMEDLIEENGQLKAELAEAKHYAIHLAQAIKERHYRDSSELSLLPTLAGVLTQIDNMTAGLSEKPTDARSALNEHMEIHAKVVNENKDLKAELAEANARVERFQDLGESGYISIITRSREAILHEFCQLQIKYGEQKHEIRQLKAELERKDEELESLCWAYSPAMAEAKINQLNEQLEQAKQERLKHFMLLRELHALVIGNYPEWLREDEHRQLVEGIERTLTETKEET